MVERRLARNCDEDPLDDPIDAAPRRVRKWMEHKARVAWSPIPRARETDGWRTLELGQIRDVVGLSKDEASLALGVSRSSSGQALLEHR